MLVNIIMIVVGIVFSCIFVGLLMEKQKDQEFAHLEVKRLCGVFGAPLPPVEEKPVDKVKEPPRPYRSREREER